MSMRPRDDNAVQVARWYRTEAIACLLAVVRNERAPASARANAASKLLEYADNKSQPIKVADLDALDPDELEDMFVQLLAHHGITLKSFAKEFRLLQRTAEAQLQLKQLERAQQQRPLPHRTPSNARGEAALPGPADARNARDAVPATANAEHALPGPPRPSEGTPGKTEPMPLVAGVDEAIVDMPHRLNVDLGNRVHLLRPGRQIVPLDVARHPLIKKFVVEEYPDHAA